MFYLNIIYQDVFYENHFFTIPVSLLSVVSNVFRKLVNNRLVYHQECLGKGLQLKTNTLLVFFLWLVMSLENLQMIGLFIFWGNMAYFLVASMILGPLNERQVFWQFYLSGTTWALALDIPKAFDWIWHAGLLQKLKLSRILGHIFCPVLSFVSNRRPGVVLDGNSSQEYSVNTGVSQDSILGPTPFLLYINDLPDVVICNMAIYADYATLYSKCGHASDLWQ